MNQEEDFDTALGTLFREALPWSDAAIANHYSSFAERAEEERRWRVYGAGLAAAGQALKQSLRASHRAWSDSRSVKMKGAML